MTAWSDTDGLARLVDAVLLECARVVNLAQTPALFDECEHWERLMVTASEVDVGVKNRHETRLAAVDLANHIFDLYWDFCERQDQCSKEISDAMHRISKSAERLHAAAKVVIERYPSWFLSNPNKVWRSEAVSFLNALIDADLIQRDVYTTLRTVADRNDSEMLQMWNTACDQIAPPDTSWKRLVKAWLEDQWLHAECSDPEFEYRLRDAGVKL
jgi:hypothetical protein